MTAGTTRMQTCPHDVPAAHVTRATVKVRVARFARQVWRTYWERRARRATALILHSLDDRTLHDIGIRRSEIESCVYGGSDRLCRYIEQWPWRIGEWREVKHHAARCCRSVSPR